LYGEVYEKIKISKVYQADMQSFLINEPEKFEEYALRDAMISLTHVYDVMDGRLQPST
jgi:hypothetical protein